jgi:hypothetical protein
MYSFLLGESGITSLDQVDKACVELNTLIDYCDAAVSPSANRSSCNLQRFVLEVAKWEWTLSY